MAPDTLSSLPSIFTLDVSDFWEQVDRRDEDECWLWIGESFHRDGYGWFYAPGLRTPAHILAYRLVHGEIPKGHVVRHTCDNRACCNPNHLITGTQRQNIEDMDRRGRRYRGSQNVGERHGLARFTDEEISKMRRMRASGWTLEKIAAEFNTRFQVVADIVKPREIKGRVKPTEAARKLEWDLEINAARPVDGRRRVTDEQLQQIRALANEGLTHQAIADQVGCSRRQVTHILAGESRKGAFGEFGKKGRRPPLTPKQRIIILARYSGGETQQALAREFGVSQSTICKIVKTALG